MGDTLLTVVRKRLTCSQCGRSFLWPMTRHHPPRYCSEACKTQFRVGLRRTIEARFREWQKPLTRPRRGA